jgi:hypothetical protein
MTATGIDLITAERERQLEDLDYSLEHDLEHDDGDLAFAAAVYASPATIFLLRLDSDAGAHSKGGTMRWVEPWPIGWDRTERTGPQSREDRIRELTKAGALIAAEIDRLSGMAYSVEDSGD